MSQITVPAGASISAALATAKAGDIVSLAAGTWNLTSSFTIPSGVTLQGTTQSEVLNTFIKFTLTGQDLIGIILPANASGITIRNVDLSSTNGVIKMMDGAGYTDITITDTNFQCGGGAFPTGQEIFGITGTVPCTNLQVTSNYFHDSLTSDRIASLYGLSGSNIDHNTFYRINGGFQLNLPGANVSFSYNYGTQVHAKPLETGMTYSPNMAVTGNVFYDFLTPDKDTMGLSVVAVMSAKTSGWTVTISNNYIRLNPYQGVYGKDGAVTGTVVEAGGFGLILNNNILGSSAAPAIITTMTPGATGSGNQTFGASGYGAIVGEGGPSGGGNPGTVGATYSSNLSNMPSPPGTSPVQAPSAPVPAAKPVVPVSGTLTLTYSDGTFQVFKVTL
jgi:hypothetical protein